MSGLLFILVTLLTFGYLGLAVHYLGHWRGRVLWPRQSGIEHSLLGALLLLHAIVLTLPVFHSGTVSLGLGTALSLLSWMMLLIFWTGSYFSRMEGLQTFLVPVAFVAVLLAEILPLPRNTYAVNDVAFLLHMVVSLLAYSLWTLLLKRHPAGRVTPFSLLVPVVGLWAAWMFSGELPQRWQWAGTAAVLLGLVINQAGPLRALVQGIGERRRQPAD